RHGAHLALHSFPTRRSSDLVFVGQPRQEADAVRRVGEGPGEALPQQLVPVGVLARNQDQGATGVAAQDGAEEGVELGVELEQALDRKSTRLNSSHVSISYAV